MTQHSPPNLVYLPLMTQSVIRTSPAKPVTHPLRAYHCFRTINTRSLERLHFKDGGLLTLEGPGSYHSKAHTTNDALKHSATLQDEFS